MSCSARRMSYMSPEQAEGRPVDARSDIFRFGSLLYEMAGGRAASRRALLWNTCRSEFVGLQGLTVSPDRKTILYCASAGFNAALMVVENFR